MSTPSFRIGRRSVLAAIAASSAIPRWAWPAAASGPRIAAVGVPPLAAIYSGQVDPALCLISEKYDGVRALWDGAVLRHRSGRVVAAPASFLSRLPALPLDGELWLGRGRFEALSSLVRRLVSRESEWQHVRYMVFDAPVADTPFESRLRRLEAMKPLARTPVEIAPQWRVADAVALEAALARVVAGGGEGLVLRLASAANEAGRSEAMLKMKPQLDAEAVVVGHRSGAGKYREVVGALEVESSDGRRFFVGSGLSDADRGAPPPLGSVITYRYRDLTSTGLPRFATYLRLHHAL